MIVMRVIGRDQAGIGQRPQQRDRAGRVAAGIGDALRAADLVALPGFKFRKAIDPAGRDAMRGRGIEDARRRIAKRWR